MGFGQEDGGFDSQSEDVPWTENEEQVGDDDNSDVDF
jgi:hypothetical protein